MSTEIRGVVTRATGSWYDVLHEGRMAECGTYRQLMDKDGVFARLARRQLAEAGEEFEG